MNQFLLYVPLTALIAYIILYIIIIGSTRNTLAKRYKTYIISVIIWSFGAFMMRTGLSPGPLFYNKILVIGFIFVPVTFYHFINTYAHITNQKLVTRIAYGYSLLLVIANYFGLIIEDATLEKGMFNYSLGPLAPMLALLSFILLTVSFVNVLVAVKKQKIALKRVKYIFIGIALVFLGSLFNLIPVIGQYPIDVIFNLVNAILITHSIYKFKFLELKIIVKKGVTYSVSTLLISFIFIFLMLLIKNYVTSIIGSSDLVLIIFMAFGFTIFFDPFRKITYTLVSKIIQKDINTQNTIKRNYAKSIQTFIELKPLKKTFLKTLKEGVHAQNVYYTAHDSFHTYKLIDSTYKTYSKLFLNDSHPFFTWFEEHSVITRLDIKNHTHFNYLLNEEIAILSTLSIDIILPLYYHDKIQGLLLIPEKENEETYQVSDIQFMEDIITQTAPVLDNAKLYEKAKKEAITDGLTGLYNHRYFHDYMTRLAKQSHIEPFSIALIDIDLFKFYNDLYGHAAGDEVLQAVSQTMVKHLKKGMTAIRYGGEEFAIIIPNMVLKEAFEFIDFLRLQISYASSVLTAQQSYITVSAGVASFPKHITNPLEVIVAADQAMYQAKHSGRNNTVLYQESKEINPSPLSDVHLNQQVKEAYLSSIYALAATIDAKDNYTFGHSENVSYLAVALAKHLGLSDNKQEILKNAGLLHDIGKIGIPETVLQKEDTLTEEEYQIMQKHVDIAVGIIKHVPNLTDTIPAVVSHHERYDGMGYPRGIKGEAIPLEARILTIVDAFDAMITGRPYKEPKTLEEVIDEIASERNKQFDPHITDSFINFVKSDAFNPNKLINRIKE